GPAMQILFALHSVKTFRFVLRLVCDFSLAEDVVSKAFLDVWRQAGNFQGRSSVPTWVLTLVRRRALTALQALTTGKLDNNNSARTTEVPDGLEQTMREAREGHGHRVFQCGSRQGTPEVIDLVYYHKRSIDEVAKITGISQRAVKSRMQSARD